MSKKTIVVAMSGGVDSSVVAAMMHKAGHNVIGITLQLYDHGQMLQKKGACCAGQDIYDAKMVADALGFPHYIFDYESKFKEQVIDDFADSYIRGETPLPCVRCNQSVKFNDLLKAAKELNADALATGHYVQKIIKNNIAQLHKGASLDKDQSYFLFGTTQEQLDYLMFPIGAQSKEETRRFAKELGLNVADKPDSQDICFVPDGNYRDILTKIRPNSNIPGRFIHVDGYDLGEHKGIINYTIGQRKGLGLALGVPAYVIKIDPETNTVYVGPESDLIKTRFTLKDVNWLAKDKNPDQLDVSVKIRSTNNGINAKLAVNENGEIEVILLEKEKSITPGQACVFYDGTRVLGGGWITRNIE
ncbi:MAG: tRNA 2-thiouridine(34) synthase MnmA [Rickettsiales bacterium]|nr:MAG: tRNA 2-thiouridine(34) synthase MnmA [Rickettsiales bacterium]